MLREVEFFVRLCIRLKTFLTWRRSANRDLFSTLVMFQKAELEVTWKNSVKSGRTAVLGWVDWAMVPPSNSHNTGAWKKWSLFCKWHRALSFHTSRMKSAISYPVSTLDRFAWKTLTNWLTRYFADATGPEVKFRETCRRVSGLKRITSSSLSVLSLGSLVGKSKVTPYISFLSNTRTYSGALIFNSLLLIEYATDMVLFATKAVGGIHFSFIFQVGKSCDLPSTENISRTPVFNVKTSAPTFT